MNMLTETEDTSASLMSKGFDVTHVNNNAVKKAAIFGRYSFNHKTASLELLLHVYLDRDNEI